MPSTAFARTPTNCFGGFFSLNVGVWVIGVICAMEGFCSAWVMVVDLTTGEPFFRWGPEHYERPLQVLSGVAGALSAYCGVEAMRISKRTDFSTDRLRKLNRFHRFSRGWFLYTIAWFLIVGLPVHVVYKAVPIIDHWPEKVPGPTKLIVDPEWPYGQPSLCEDTSAMKARFIARLNEKQKIKALSRVLRSVERSLLNHVVPCRKIVRYFWLWAILSIFVRWYFTHVMDFYKKVVLHGGDGEMFMGHLDDLEKPVVERQDAILELIRERIKDLHRKMDADGDGRISLEEMLAFVEQARELGDKTK